MSQGTTKPKVNARSKAKAKKATANVLPIAPWIYINDPTGNGEYAYELAAIMPNAEHIQLTQQLTDKSPLFPLITHAEYREKIVVVTTNALCLDRSTRYKNGQLVKQASIKHGCNFASINIVRPDTADKPRPTEEWGTNHLDLCVNPTDDPLEVKETAQKIYKWLFSVLSVLEQLHLIPDEQMRSIGTNSAFSDYEYCPLNENRYRPRDQKVQFVVLIHSKPVVGPNNRISWQVVDKTGTANFYYTYRDSSSQYTWDWVLALQPGDKKCLPRMPGVLIKESTFTTILKSPFRLTGSVLRGTGHVIHGVGHVLHKSGTKISLGKRSEWVSQDDVGTDSKGRKYKIVREQGGYIHYERSANDKRSEVQIFTATGEKTWKDVDSLASTTAGSVLNEKNI